MEVRTLQSALEYASLGWRVVPVHTVIEGKCSCGNVRRCKDTLTNRGKHPRISEWQKNATTSEETICGWFEKWPDSNVGVQLGPTSGVVDFETDTAEGEQRLADWFGGVIPPTPMFTSGRGRHRLFRWRDDLPKKANVPLGWGDLKLGSDDRGSQSVFPPSWHFSGQIYKWLVSPGEVDLAEISDLIIANIWNPKEEANGKPRKPIEHWQGIAEGVGEGKRQSSLVSLIGGLLYHLANIDDTHALEVAYQIIVGINQNNKPPLDDAELKANFQSILRREKQRRLTEAADSVLSRTPEQRIAEATKEGVKTPENMRLVIVRSDPPSYELHAPQFHKARDGCLRLTAQQLNSFASIKIQALEQADYPLPPEFSKAWNRKGGLYEQLVHSADERVATAVEKRLATIAEYLIGRLQAAVPRADGKDEPDMRKPVKMSDGSVWFRWNETWKDGVFDGVIQKEDQKRMANHIGLKNSDFILWPKSGENRRRYCRFEREKIEALRKIAEMTDDCAHAQTPVGGNGPP